MGGSTPRRNPAPAPAAGGTIGRDDRHQFHHGCIEGGGREAAGPGEEGENDVELFEDDSDVEFLGGGGKEGDIAG